MKRLIAIVLLLFSSQIYASASLGGKTVTNEALYFGGSFSPPTLEHVGLIINLMARFGFHEGRMLPTVPYKAGAAPAEVSKGLTELAVETADETLEINGADYVNFRRTDKGESQWQDRLGREFKLVADDFEIRNNIKGDTLTTLRHLAAERGANNVFWLSGGDSFGSIDTWTPEWRELLNSANWMVVSREGNEKDPKNVDFRKDNPLKGVISDEVLMNYTYYFDQTNQTHVYKNKTEGKPGIYVVLQPALNDSSSLNRASLADDGDHDHAQQGLPPSVFKECVENGYFLKDKKEGYRALTQKNLAFYTNWLLWKIERKHAHELDPQTSADFAKFTRRLIEILNVAAQETHQSPRALAMLKFLTEWAGEQIDNVKNIKNIGKVINDTAKKYGARTFAITFVALEFAELTIIPPLLYYFGGVKAMALTPLIHPNEFLTIPAFIAWTVYKKIRDHRALAGDLATYKRLADYRNRLVRGDAEYLVARAQLSGALGINGADLTLNIVKSRMPRWVPLALRKWQDSKIKWYDLNLSTNELISILDDAVLTSELKEAADGEHGLYAHLLLAAVVSRPRSLLQLEIFSMQRYFRMITFTAVPEELLSGYQPAEQEFIRRSRESVAAINQSLESAQIKQLGESIGYVYAVNRALSSHPELINDEAFWKMAGDIVVTGYPGREAKASSSDTNAKLRTFYNLISELRPELNERAARYNNLLSRDKNLQQRHLHEAGVEYLRRHEEVFAESKSSEKVQVQAQSVGLRADDLKDTNLDWNIQLLDKTIQREIDSFDKSYDRAGLYLKVRTPRNDVASIFREAKVQILERIEEQRRALKSLEFRWLEMKYPYQSSAYAANESAIAGHADMSLQFLSLSDSLNRELGRLHQLISMMNGTTAVEIDNLPKLKAKAGEFLAVQFKEPGFFKSCASIFSR